MERSNIGDRAKIQTDDDLSVQLSGIVQLTPAEIKQLFPLPNDREQLAGLIDIVNAAATDAEKSARLMGSIDRVAGAVIKLLGVRP